MPSTVIKTFSYDALSKVLHITFISGKQYQYLNVAEQTYNAMKSSFSKGEYFNRYIKDQHQYRQIKEYRVMLRHE